MMMVSLAYRAILAEPRTKTTATEDYNGGAPRGDYMGGADSMNQYAFPMGTQYFFSVISVALSLSQPSVRHKTQP